MGGIGAASPVHVACFLLLSVHVAGVHGQVVLLGHVVAARQAVVISAGRVNPTP